MSMEGDCLKYLKKGCGTENRGGDTKIFKRWGKLGQGVGALKSGGWNPFTNYGCYNIEKIEKAF